VRQRLPNSLRSGHHFHSRPEDKVETPGRSKDASLRKWVRSGAGGSRSGQTSSLLKCAQRCVVLVVCVYFIRGTVLPWVLPVPAVGWILLTGLVLLVAVAIVIVGGGGWRWSWVMVLLAFAAGISQAEQPKLAALHWLGLALLILAVGPVVLNPVAMEVRSAAWRFSTNGMMALTGIFFLWYLLRFPSFGAGDFSSFMNQSMLLGPIVGMGIVIALARAIHGRSWRWGLLAILGLVPLLASGSRVAALATIVAGCFLLIRRKPILGLGVLVLCACLIYGFISRGGNLASSPDSLTGAMTRKGDLNSRADMWETRLLEFKSSPIIGIGVAMGTGGADKGGGKEENGNIRVEPGSSYLAVLSMTGGLGAIAFCSALGLLLFGFIGSRHNVGLDKDILSIVGIYLAVHGVAEGWILGFGSSLCFLFWLWLGKVGDAAWQPLRAKVKRRLLAHKRNSATVPMPEVVSPGVGYPLSRPAE
jgi:hypothetical protein